jgi:hypothetical protein
MKIRNEQLAIRSEELSWFVYEVENYLEAVVQGICDTVVNCCKKEARIDIPMGTGFTAWFKVSNDTEGNERGTVVRVEGVSGVFRFRFRSGKGGFTFAVENYQDPEHIFYHFVSMIQVYRNNAGLQIIDMDYICDITEDDSPALTFNNYTAVTDASFEDMQRTLGRKFGALTFRSICGKYTIIMYSGNTDTKFLPDRCIAVCQKFLDDFKRLYFFDDAMLFCIRVGGKQHIYFYVNGIGLFYNTRDSSRAFLERECHYITTTLSNMAADIDKGWIREKVIRKRGN